jgi:hypothetical protein
MKVNIGVKGSLLKRSILGALEHITFKGGAKKA